MLPSSATRVATLLIAAMALGACVANPGGPLPPPRGGSIPAPSESADPTQSAAPQPSADVPPTTSPPPVRQGRTPSRPWYAAAGNSWVVTNAGGAGWRLAVRDVPQEARGGLLLSVSLELEPPSSTLHTYDIETGRESWAFKVSTPVNAAAFWGDDVIYAPSTIDGGVWVITPGTATPRKLLDTVTPGRPDDFMEYTRVAMVSSPTFRTAASEVLVNDGNEVDVFRAGMPGLHIKLPDGLSTRYVTDTTLITRSDAGFTAFDLVGGNVVWQLPVEGLLEGAYLAHGGKALVVARFDPEGSGDLQLIAVSVARGKFHTLRKWPAGGPQPHFWPQLSSDEGAFFSAEFEDPEAWLTTNAPDIDGIVVDVDDGSDRTTHLSAWSVESPR